MSTIVMMVPTSDTAGASTPRPGTANPGYIPGETAIAGFEDMLQVDSVEWQSDLENEKPTAYRRTVHVPKVSDIKITRQLDGGTAVLTRWALGARITRAPWEIHFFKTMGDGPAPTAVAAVGTDANMHFRYLTMKLYNPLIVKYQFDFTESGAQETLEVSPSAIEWVYYKADDTQKLAGQISVKYDVQLGTVL